MRKLLMVTASTIAALVFATSTGLAQRDGVQGPPASPDGAQARPRGPMRGGQGPGRMQGRGGAGRGDGFGGLNLTDAQRGQARDIVRNARDEAAPIVDQLALARKDLNRAIFADKADAGKVKDLSARVESLQKQVADVRLKARSSVAALLTPEQRQQMRTMPERRFGGPIGRRGAPGPRAAA